ncbi:GNAT family N-acetyltransferase [Aliiroseovarius sp. 2305UL8-7]|uniref:GNAT family N-acetyltransferase n=1 Tax=Aliiroseovarius conchicola TaxID=3121637 RepID=UPI0035270D07
MNTLEFATDLLVQSGQCDVRLFSDRIVQTTPDEPNFWFGNRVLFKAAPVDADTLIAQFRADIPDAEHICIGWDIASPVLSDIEAVFEKTELKVEQADTLSLPGKLKRTEAPDGIVIRPFQTMEDWAQSEAIGKIDLLKEDYVERGMDTFLRNKSAARRAQIGKGLGQWFGAFDGDRLAGDMGIFHDDRLIRYQSVQTHEDYRRRGICSALLCASLDWARARAPNARPVIVANANSDAGRLYRRAGFALAETTVSAYLPPKE